MDTSKLTVTALEPGVPCTESNLGEYYPLAYHCAQRFLWRYGDVDDIVQWGMVGLLSAVREREAAGLAPPTSGVAFAQAIFARWMPWQYSQRKSMAQDWEGESYEPYHAPIFDGWEEYLTHSTLERYLEEVEAVLGEVSARVARNLLEPGEEVIHAAVEVMKEKQRRHESGEKVRGFNTLRITQEIIRDAVGLDESTWAECLAALRTFTRRWVEAIA